MSSDEEKSAEQTDGPTFVSPIAKPVADSKLSKKLLKLTKKVSKEKGVRRGVREVVKAMRKGQKGIMVIAADISPIDVISHVPVLCEQNEIPYIYVPSKQELGVASQTKRPTSVVLITPFKDKEKDEKLFKLFKKCKTEVGEQQVVY
eukprot:TRINITY_DN1308_c0_g1_i1.p1 TRINITY_DN1308_c0_g1~~TRINITY_DN1308_c0_g1_i1.p1  ORF type:complete len:147 (+),score=52.08 TRINITY_DN1308_c0_g1_i1:109-549(+)